MPEVASHSSLHRLHDMLGLSVWRLRCDVVKDIAAQRQAANTAKERPMAPKEPLIAQERPGAGNAAPAATEAAEALVLAPAAPVLTLDGRHQLRVYSHLTLLSIDGYGTWWLPALSHTEGKARLFRSEEEMGMLQALLNGAGLKNLAAFFQRIDEFLADSQMPANRLPPRAEDLLSLPTPWLWCGAIVRKEGEALAAEHPFFPLIHPLMLLKKPQQKRNAWQQILAYRQEIHD